MTNEEINKLIRKWFLVNEDDIPPLINHKFISTRRHLAKIFSRLGYKLGAEVGVSSGRYSKVLFDSIKGLKLICVDPWKEYDGLQRIPQKKVTEKHDICMRRLEGRNVEYMKMTGVEAVKLVPDYSLDFVYIDAAHHFDNVMTDIICWSKKVRPGGIVAGRNYHSFYRSGAMMAVNAYTRAHNITEWYVTSQRGRDPYPSWFWVRQDKTYDEYG